jgi:hypothetical protein
MLTVDPLLEIVQPFLCKQGSLSDPGEQLSRVPRKVALSGLGR